MMKKSEEKVTSLFDFGKPRVGEPKPLGHLYTMYICGEIMAADNYIEHFETLRNADSSDVVKIHINSYGGDLMTAIQFLRAMAESDAAIIASVEGQCMSAATMIFLAAHAYEISEHSLFMFHNYSGGTMGKGGEMYDHIVNEREWSKKIVSRVYDGFLTESEITSILDNKDIWMDGEEVAKRLDKKVKKDNDAEDALEAAKNAKPAAKKTTVAKKVPAKKAAPATRKK
jgi:ATP-dependent protease ClpP protease subunit